MNLNVGVGDIVTVIPDEQGRIYTDYKNWFEFYGISNERWQQNADPLIENEMFVVKAIAPHHQFYDRVIGLIENCKTGFRYLYGIEALKPYTENLQTKDNVYINIINHLKTRVCELERQCDFSRNERETVKKYRATLDDLKVVCESFKEIMEEI